MKKFQCEICGGTDIKKIGADLFECSGCGIQYSAADVRNLLTEIPDTVPAAKAAPQQAPEAAPVSAPAGAGTPTLFCKSCGKPHHPNAVICPNCGCATGIPSPAAAAPIVAPISEQSYADALTNCAVFLIAGIALLAAGILLGLFLNRWLGAILCLASEMVLLIPNTKVQNLNKQHFAHIGDKKEVKIKSKAVVTALKAQNPRYRLCFILACVSLAGLIFCLI